jgi:hypothetical protein
MSIQDPFADVTPTLGLARVGMDFNLQNNMDLLDQSIAALQYSMISELPPDVDAGTF